MKAFQHHEQNKGVREGEQALNQRATGTEYGTGAQNLGTTGAHHPHTGVGAAETLGKERVVSERTEYVEQKKGTVYEARPKAVIYEEKPKEDIYEKVPARTVQTVEVQRVVPATGGAREEIVKPATGAHAHTFTKEIPVTGHGVAATTATETGHGVHTTTATGTGLAGTGTGHHAPEEQHKKSFIEKVKEKLPGHHGTH